MTLSPTLRRIGPALLLLIVVAVVIVACVPGATPSGSGGVPSPSIHPPLEPAVPKDPLSLFAWIFTPIFQVMIIILIAVYQFLHNLGVASWIAIIHQVPGGYASGGFGDAVAVTVVHNGDRSRA